MPENNRLTVVVGASQNPSRYAYMAAEMLNERKENFELLSIKKGELFGKGFLDLRNKPEIKNIDTLTLYIGAVNLVEWNEYLIGLKPKRIIFNPGTENMQLANEAKKNGIETIFACTLVMLSTGQY